MESTYTRTPVAVESQTVSALWNGTKTCLRAIAAVLAEGARGEEFNRRFTTPLSAHFATLPRRQQDRVLNGGGTIAR